MVENAKDETRNLESDKTVAMHVTLLDLQVGLTEECQAMCNLRERVHELEAEAQGRVIGIALAELDRLIAVLRDQQHVGEMADFQAAINRMRTDAPDAVHESTDRGGEP